MRKPTPKEIAFKWHAGALAAVAAGRPIAGDLVPECGFFKRRLVRGGPFVPAKIWLDGETDEDGDLIEDEALKCEVNFIRRDPNDEWLWIMSNPVSEAEYHALVAHIRDREDVAGAPEQRPRSKIDWLTMPVRKVPK